MAGFHPRITHRAATLDPVQEIIAAGLGVGLPPMAAMASPGVRILPLATPHVEMRSYAVARHGRRDWPPLALVATLLAAG